jgi:hypothetical protein
MRLYTHSSAIDRRICWPERSWSVRYLVRKRTAQPTGGGCAVLQLVVAASPDATQTQRRWYPLPTIVVAPPRSTASEDSATVVHKPAVAGRPAAPRTTAGPATDPGGLSAWLSITKRNSPRLSSKLSTAKLVHYAGISCRAMSAIRGTEQVGRLAKRPDHGSSPFSAPGVDGCRERSQSLAHLRRGFSNQRSGAM